MNQRIAFALLAPAITIAITTAGCHDNRSSTTQSAAMQAMSHTATASIKPSQAATTQPINSNVAGTVTFTQIGDNVRVSVDLTGFVPDSVHGFHIHEHGDFTDAKLVSAGPHFNPTGHHHGAPGSPLSHAGDLGNLTADASGNVKTELTVRGISLDPASPVSIIGKGLIVHAKPDDLKTDPSGNSGDRVAGGKIEAGK